MSASRTLVFHDKEIWRAWSTLFVHGDGKHLLANTFLFFILGFFLNGYFGFLLFPIVAFFIGGVTNLIVLAGMPSETHLVGASGIVFWMGGAWLVLYTLLESRKSLFQRTLRALGVGALMFMPAEAFDPHVSYQAHLVGFILGVVCGLIFYQMRRSEFLAAEIREMIVDEADVIPDGVPPQ